ncbi:MAG TPA: alkaline phosphatase family protein [Vicinamibacterales bacterium]
MRYLRMFSNAVLAAAVGAIYLSVLFLQLNPTVPLYPLNLASLAMTLALFYGVHFVVVFYALIVLRQMIGGKPLSPGWVSLRLLAWLLAADASGVATLMWFNLRSYSPMLTLETSRRMAASAAILTACAFMFLGVALAHYSFGRRKGRVGASFVSLALAASLVLPLVARGPGKLVPLVSRPLDIDAGIARPVSSGRVVLIVLDGGSLDFVSTAALEGRLPSFGKILDSGAAMHLATIRPTQPDPVWTTVATGKLPARTGVRSAAHYRVPASSDPLELLPDSCFAHGLVQFGFVTAVPHDAASVRARPIWSILGSAGLTSGVVNWPLTYPAQPVRGYLVSEQFYRPGAASLEPDDPGREVDSAARSTALSIQPPDLFDEARAAGDTAAPGVEAEPRRDLLGTQAFITDRMYEQVARALQEKVRPDFSAVRYRELDVAGHRFLRYAMPRDFGDVSPDERRRFGQVLEAAYARVDAIVGRALAGLGPDDLLLVVSGFGMEPLSVEKRMLERYIGNPDLSGTHEDAPDGFMLAYGAAVNPGRKDRASVADVVPTILYFLGLPVAHDMDGYAKTDIFRREFSDSRPMAFIQTYER